MKSQQIKVIQEKINALHKSIDLDGGRIAPIERDLMLSYLRQLYGLFLDLETNETIGTRQDTVRSEPEAQPTPKRPAPDPIKRTYQPPRIIEIPDAREEKAPEPVNFPEAQPVAPAPKPEPEAPKPVAPQREIPKARASNPRIEGLFEQRRATELSEKLSESPINDLTKAMSINDRLLYMNELFGKNMGSLDETLRQLNHYGNLNDAKPLLFEIAEKNNWIDPEKEEIVRSFIKLVRRRYV